jgi:hypothetical protein
MTGPEYQRGVKRRGYTEARYDLDNLQYEPNYKPDPEKQDHFYMFTVLGYNFAWCIPYKTT